MKRRPRVAREPDDPVLTRLRELCLALPETSETSSWGHPNFRAGKQTFVAYEYIKDRRSIAFRLEPDEARHFLGMKGFFATPYGKGRWVSLDAGGRLSWKLIATLIDRSYRLVALKRMLDVLDAIE
jgi:predicted DNA-binding protein (MmcQ/YjbR family)